MQQQRRLDLLTITSPHNLNPSTPCKMVFITARVHPGESPASYVCQGKGIIILLITVLLVCGLL